MRRHLLAAISLTVAALFTTSGCAALTGGLDSYKKPVTDAELAGTWTGDCQSKLVLGADHTLSVSGFPRAADTSTSTVTRRTTGAGTWRIQHDPDPDYPTTVQLSLPDAPASLDIAAGKSGTIVLSAGIGDPDEGNACRYTKA